MGQTWRKAELPLSWPIVHTIRNADLILDERWKYYRKQGNHQELMTQMVSMRSLQ